MSGPLKNPRHERFAQEYLECGDAFEAALHADFVWPDSREGYYVYFLIDGRDGAIFYVGKGHGNRLFQHRRDAGSINSVNQVKAAKIIECGDALREFVFVDGLDEVEAFAVERAMIRRLRVHGLTNISSGTIHPLESLLARIDRGISIIRPYNEWIRKAHPSQLAAAAKLDGSPVDFYVKFVAQYRHLRATVAEQLNSIKGNSDGAAWR